jgi:CDP-glycerol glycerophosphotransferase (TagB/SpsB family)
MEAIRLMPSIRWKVKFHPVEDDSFYRKMGDDICGRLKFHPRDLPLEQAVSDADIVTTVYSTAGMEAMVMNKPVIIAPATARVHEMAWWRSMGGGTYAASAQDFQAQVAKLVSDQEYRTRQIAEQRQFLSKSFASQGHAAERIVDMLEQYSKRSQSPRIRPGTSDRTEKSLALPSGP